MKTTVELAPSEHRALRQFCAQVSADLDLPIVAGSEVLRTLLGFMCADDALAQQVRNELAKNGGNRRR